MDTTEAAFDNKFTKTFGFPVEKVRTHKRDYLTGPVKDFIAESPFLVMATSNAEGKCDTSPKGGKPGFVRVLDDHHLLVPDVAGNRLFQSYLNMDENPYVALLFFVPGLADVVRVNGSVTLVTREDLDSHKVEHTQLNPDGDRNIQQGIIIEIEESYGHCPRALTYSDLWDLEGIQRRRGTAHEVRKSPPPRELEPTA